MHTSTLCSIKGQIWGMLLYIYICTGIGWHICYTCTYSGRKSASVKRRNILNILQPGCHDFSLFISTTMFRELVWLQLSLKMNFKQTTSEYFHLKFVINVIFAKLLWASLNFGLYFQITTFELIIVNNRERRNCNVWYCWKCNHTC